MEEGVEGTHGCGLVDRRIKYGLPQALSLHGEAPNLDHPVPIELLSRCRFQKDYIFIDLRANITAHLGVESGVAERRVEDKQRNIEIAGLDFIPFQHGAADVVAANQQVRPGESPNGTAVHRGARDIGAGVGTKITGVTHGFRLFAEIDAHFGGSDHRPVVFRIHRDDIHGNQRFHRTAAGNPGDLFAVISGRLGIDII